MANPMGRPSLPYYVAIFLLVASVTIGSILVTLLVSRPSAETIRFDVGTAEAQACPSGVRATVCYGFSITNAGEARGTARCSTEAAEGSQALFLTDESTTLVPLEAGEQRILIVAVTAEGDPGTVGTASVTCEPA